MLHSPVDGVKLNKAKQKRKFGGGGGYDCGGRGFPFTMKRFRGNFN